MRIIASKPVPSQDKLIGILREHFGPDYSCKAFGVNGNILVEKSPAIGAQISVYGNEFTVVGTPPSVWSGLLTTITSALSIPITPGLSGYQAFERQVGKFLIDRFN